MKKYIISLLIIVNTIYSYASTIPNNDPQADAIFILLNGTKIQISLADFVNLKPSEYKKLTGEKLKLEELIALKVTQNHFKKAIRNNGSVDVQAVERIAKRHFKFNWGGFFLGLLIPVGLIITFFIKDEKRKDRIESAAYATLLALSIGLIVIFLVSLGNGY